jgi:hypothetical protein
MKDLKLRELSECNDEAASPNLFQWLLTRVHYHPWLPSLPGAVVMYLLGQVSLMASVIRIRLCGYFIY